MEILFTPKDPNSPLEDVPFICGDLRYDLGPFLTYPIRTGRPQLIKPSLQLGRLLSEITHIPDQEPSETLEPHLQTWLFFGLLSEFIGINTSDPAEHPLAAALYDKFVTARNGKKCVTTEPLFEFIREHIWHPGVVEDENGGFRAERWLHMGICIQYTNVVLAHCPADFDSRIRYSIGALGECLTYCMNALYNRFNVEKIIGSTFAKGFLSPSVCKSMVEKGGWCPSDISRILANFDSLNTHHLLSKLDRTGSGRDHTGCDDSKCQAYQIEPEKYIIGHVGADCDCELIVIDEMETIKILHTDSSYPLLKISNEKGTQAETTKIEIIESTPESEYIAISHVWADGLGNPNETSLHQCHISRLHELVQTINSDSDSHDKSYSLVWLDTLCCPVKNREGKEMSLTKMRQVYENAYKTLVLDASLQCISTAGLHIFEILSRIYTSSWMRRLWTLQEAALSKSLHFRFCDTTISLDMALAILRTNFNSAIPYRGIIFDLLQETRMMRVFFHPSEVNLPAPDLPHLDRTLKHRSASVPSDEPLCISTLMGLPPDSILQVANTHEDRMQHMWHLLVSSHRVPATIIFLLGDHLPQPGWRWAPRSLIGEKGNVRDLRTRGLVLNDPQMGSWTARGLRVTFPGVRFAMRMYDDDLPRNPWKDAFPQVREAFVMFRNERGEWFRLSDNHMISPDTADYYSYSAGDIRAWKEKGDYPLHRLIMTGNAAVVFRERKVEGMGWDGMLVDVEGEVDGGLAVRMLSSVRVIGVDRLEYLVWDTIGRIAKELRYSEITRTMLGIKDTQSEEYKMAVESLEVQMKAKMQEAIDKDLVFVKACQTWISSDIIPSMWRYVAEWYNDDVIGEFLAKSQMWFVD